MMRIENQAVMFALLAKYTIETCGEEGRKVIQEGMIRYGRERGSRMAKYAVEDGSPLELWAYLAYTEWMPDEPGQAVSGIEAAEPELITYVRKCPWCAAWEKYGLLEYGREYCVNVDRSVYEGFCPGSVCTPLGKPISFGGEQCRFNWGKPLTAEDQAKLQKKTEAIGTKFVRDFQFHTSHIYHTITDVIHKRLPEQAQRIIEQAVMEYIGLFGVDEFEPIFEFTERNF